MYNLVSNLSLLWLLIGWLVPHQSQSQKIIASTAVTFTTSNAKLQAVYNEAEKQATGNIADFGPYKVLVEGAGYQHVRLEAQPIGGYMFGKRNLEVAKNNQLIFMDHQRADGRLPGMISYEQDKLVPQYGWFQGYCFPESAFELYFWLEKDTTYLHKLYRTVEAFDGYLWKTRDSDGDGCLESWCVRDTGEDNCTRLAGVPDAWPFEFAPSAQALQELTPEQKKYLFPQQENVPAPMLPVPIESMDMMSYSYAGREALAEMAKELQNGQEEYWRDKADEVKQKLKDYLWQPAKNAAYDRGPDNQVLDVLTHNSLRCMYFNSFDQQMADAFVKHHLLNPKEFWTPLPMPSIAANDSLFRNYPGNNWSGQPQGLTYQRAIRALENYGHYAEITLLGQKLLEAIGQANKFTQQYDPYTGAADTTSDGYGPAILATLEYINRMYGVHLNRNQLYWTNLNSKDEESSYEQTWGNHTYRLTSKNGFMTAFIDNRPVFTSNNGTRVITDLEGNILEVVGVDYQSHKIEISLPATDICYTGEVRPNVCYRIAGPTKLAAYKRIPFDYQE